MTASNEDTAEFIELAPSSSHYLRPSDCRGAMIGLKVSIKHQFGKVPLGVRKSAILAYTTAFNELADEIVGREVWDGSNVCQSIIQQLCCSGHLCGGDGDGGSSQVSSSIMSNNMNGNTIPNPLTGAGSLSLLTSSVNSNGQSRTQQGRPVVRLNYIGLDAGEGVPIVIVWLKLGMDANWVINAAPPTVTDPHILCPSYNQFLNVS